MIEFESHLPNSSIIGQNSSSIALNTKRYSSVRILIGLGGISSLDLRSRAITTLLDLLSSLTLSDNVIYYNAIL